MARAKEHGGGRVEVYAAHMHAQVVERLELQTELRQALAEHAFVLEYQPVVSSGDFPGDRGGGARAVAAGGRVARAPGGVPRPC